jgi:hypothetical protein
LIDKIFNILLIKDEEKGFMLYFIIFFLVLGSGMAIGRGTTDALFFKRYGIEYLPIMYIILGFLLFLTSTVYAAFSDRLPPEKFFKILNIVLILLLLGAWISMSFFTYEHIYPIYFLIYEIASELLVIHATLYLAQNMDALQAKRLTPIILAGSQIGTIIGGLFLALSASQLGVQNLLIVWCVLLGISILMITRHHTRTGYSLYFRHPRKNSNKLKQSVQDISVGAKFMKKSDLVRYSSFALFFMVIVFYILCYSTNRIYNEVFKTEESLTAFFGVMVVITNSLALILQLFVTNRVIQRFGIKTVNLFFPFSTILCYITLIFSFTLPAGIIASLNKDSIMPAFRNPVRNLFYNALPSFIQGRARAMSVVIVIPLALLVCGGILWATQHLDNPLYFLSIGFIFTCLYAYFNVRMNRAYVMEIVTHLRNSLFIPGKHEQNAIKSAGKDVLTELQKGVQHDDEQICIAYAKTLAHTFPEQAVPVLIARLQGANDSVRNQLFQVLVPLNPDKFHEYLWNEYETADVHLQATILKTLFRLSNEKALAMIQDLLKNTNPRLQAAGIYGCVLHEPDNQNAYLAWNCLLKSDKTGDILSALDILRELDKDASAVILKIDKAIFTNLLSSKNIRILKASLQVISLWPINSMQELSTQLISVYQINDPDIRGLTVNCAHVLSNDDQQQFIFNAIEDAHPLVREKAINLFQDGNLRETLVNWIKDKNLGSPRTQSSILAKLAASGVPNVIMEDIAILKARDAEAISQALNTLQKHPESQNFPSVELITHTLQERLEQIVDLTLQAMKSTEDPYTINTIQAGIKSKDRRIAAQSMEALRNIDNQGLAVILAHIMEDTKGNGPSSKDNKGTFNTPKDALDWCTKRHDPWLKACAEEALKVFN